MDRAEHVPEVSSGIVRDVEAAVRAEQVHAVAILRVHSNLAEVHRTRIQRRDRAPAVAAVRTEVDAALAASRFDDGVDEARIGVEEIETDTSLVALRQPLRQQRPRDAAVARAVDAAAGAAAVEPPRLPLPL